VTDAPSHGKQYHHSASDNHKDRIPEGTLENLMVQLSKVRGKAKPVEGSKVPSPDDWNTVGPREVRKD